MKQRFESKPSSRFLLMSANILYGTSLAADLHKRHESNPDIKVGFYRETRDLQDCNIVVCSLESLHHLDGQQFDAILIDEVRSISRLVGGATMADFSNIYQLQELATRASEIVVCDADLVFKMDASETNTLSYDFMRLVLGSRPVLHASLTHPRPDHLNRSVKMLFDHGIKLKNTGKREWVGDLTEAARAWKADNTKRFAVCVGSKGQLSEVYKLLTGLDVPVKPYSGDTNESSKFQDLQDADTAWLQFGCMCGSTTSLSIGVDPKTIEFDRVFMWTHPQGCMLLAMFQAAMRFGRQANHPLGNQTISLLVKCMPPGEREKLVRLGKKKPIVNPTYDEEYKRLVKRRGAATRMMAREITASGGRSFGVAPARTIADQILRVMAHGLLERKFQIVNHAQAVMQCIRHYGWTVEPESFDESETRLSNDTDEVDEFEEDEDDKFGAGFSEIEKWQHILSKIVTDGEEDFFNNCYGIAVDEKTMRAYKSSVQQYMVRAYWILKPIGRLPHFPEDGGDENGGEDGDSNGSKPLSAADQMLLLNKPGVLDGLGLNAHMRCMDAKTVMLADNVRRNDSDSKVPHPLLRPAMGHQMEVAGRLAMMLGVERPFEPCELSEPLGLEWIDIGSEEPSYGVPIVNQGLKDALEQGTTEFPQFQLDELQIKPLRRSNYIKIGSQGNTRYFKPASGRILDIARRETFKQSTDADKEWLRDLHALVSEMQPINANAVPKDVLGLLHRAALLLGMKLIGAAKGDMERVTHPAATAKDGRLRVVSFLRFERLLPDIVDDWNLYSPRLGYKVCTMEWRRAHESLDEEEGQFGLMVDTELDHTLYAAPRSTGNERVEKIDGDALDKELDRLNQLSERGHLTDRDKRWRDWLTRAHADAVKQPGTPIRLLHVVYGKSAHRVIGRRTASHPSMQHCPSGLRPLLIRHYYHDIDIVNCHPSLMIQVAVNMGVPPDKIERLAEYVNNRAAVLQRIGDHYGIPAAKAKFGVLIVLNGGSIAKWVNGKDTGCTRGKNQDQADLRDLEKAANTVHDAFFAMPQFKNHVESLRSELKATATAKVKAAEERVRAASSSASRDRARTELGNARRKASTTAIERSVFSACIFELEDMVLTVIDEHFQSNGWTVSSLQFDGLHVEHRATDTYDEKTGGWVQLEAAIRGAEQAIESKLGYKIKLKEKELFEKASTESGEA